jgi:hypothetical protein
MKTLQIFKAGKHVSASGETLAFSEAELVASAKAYDPKLHEAPIVIGHPKHDDPAYGWIGGVRVEGDSYFADPNQVDLEFAEAVKAGKYKKISASFYAPDSPSNPVQGVYYLRHVGFLGAMPPAVKGMKPVNFAEAEEGVLEFGEIDFMDWDDMTIAGLFSNLREWMISKFNLETADQVIPIYAIDGLKMSAAQDDIKPEMPMDYSEGDKPVTIDFAEKEAALAAREADIAKREQALKEHEFAEWFDGMVGAGKAYPHEKDKTVAALMSLSSISQPIEFSEGGETKSQTLLETYKASFVNRPKLIEFNELPTGDTSLPSDPEEYALLIRQRVAKAKAEGRDISFAEAQNLVEAGK